MLFEFLATLLLIRTNMNYCYELCASQPGMGVTMAPSMMNQQMAICNCTPIGYGGVPGMFMPPGGQTPPGFYPPGSTPPAQQLPEFETITQCHTQVHTDCTTKVVPKYGGSVPGIDNGLLTPGQLGKTVASPGVGVGISNCIPGIGGSLGFVGIQQTPQQIGGVCTCPPSAGRITASQSTPTITNLGSLAGTGKFAENFCIDESGRSNMITDCLTKPTQPTGARIGDSVYPAINRNDLGSHCPPC